jgi:hypothetical protein
MTTRKPPIEFDLQAIPLDDAKPIETYHFRAMPQIPGGLLVQAGAQDNQMRGALEFMYAVIHPADADRFDELLHSKDPYVDPDDLGELFKWLQEQYAGRPTDTPPASVVGRFQPASGPISTGDGRDTLPSMPNYNPNLRVAEPPPPMQR